MKNDHFQEHVGAGERGIPKDSLKAPIEAASAKGVCTRLDSHDFNDLALLADSEARRPGNAFHTSKWQGIAAELRTIAKGVRDPDPEPIVLTWVDAKRFTVDGKPLPPCGKGLALCWLALAQHAAGDEPLPIEYVGMDHKAVANAVKRAVQAATAVSAPLAAAFKSIGTQGGRLVVKRALEAPVELRAAALVRACQTA